MNNIQSDSDRFLIAYNSIDQFLRNECKDNYNTGFKTLVNIISESNRTINYYQDILKQYGRLRNAIVHGKCKSYDVIAEPHEKIVDDIERIEKIILNPPKVFSSFCKSQKTVYTLDKHSSIKQAIAIMKDKKYSQIPIVTKHENFHDLLTANTISLWLAINIKDEGILLENTECLIENVLECKEKDWEEHKFISRNAEVFEALEHFNLSIKNGKQLSALLVTQNGKKTEKILGIVTAADLPKILNDCY